MARPFSVVIDCRDPKSLAESWAPAPDYTDAGWPHEPHVVQRGKSGFDAALLLLQGVDEPKQRRNRVHIDVYADDIHAEAERLEALGAKRLSDPYDEHGARGIVMGDAEGSEFCACAGVQ